LNDGLVSVDSHQIHHGFVTAAKGLRGGLARA
jgi:hypothetical protein